MKRILTISALAVLFVTGCATERHHYGASDDPAFSTPSWGTSTEMPGTDDEIEMTPSADPNAGNEPQMPPSASDPNAEGDSFGPQQK